MYYIVNSYLSEGETFRIEANAAILPLPSHKSGYIENNSQILCETLNQYLSEDNLLSNVDIQGKLTITSQTDDTFIILNGNASNYLGFTQVSSIFSNSQIANEPVKFSMPMSNIESLNYTIANTSILKVPLYPLDYTIEGICSVIQDGLVSQSGKNWQVQSNNQRVEFSIEPNNVFSFDFFKSPTLAKSLGYSLDQSNIEYQSITGTVVPLLNPKFNLAESLQTTIKSNSIINNRIDYSFITSRVSANQFIDSLENRLQMATGFDWNVQINVNILNLNNSDRVFTLLPNSKMYSAMDCLGISPNNLNVPVPAANILIGTNPINRNIVFEDNASFNLRANLASYKIYNLVTPYTVDTLDYINNLGSTLNQNTGLVWNASMNRFNRLQLSLNTVTYQFQLLLGNTLMSNIGNSLGFNTGSNTNWITSYTGANPVKFNSNIQSSDSFLVNIRQVTPINYSFLVNSISGQELIARIQGLLQTNTGKQWSVTLDNKTLLITIQLLSPDYTFSIPFSKMSQFADILGFSNVDTPFGLTITGTNKINTSFWVDIDNIFYVTLQDTQNIQYSNTYYINIPNKINYYPIDELDIFSEGLRTITELEQWDIKYINGKITISLKNLDSKFKILWNDTSVSIRNFLGYHVGDTTVYTNQTTGSLTPNFNTNIMPSNQMVISTLTTVYYKDTSYTIDLPDQGWEIYQFLDTLLDSATNLSWKINYINGKIQIYVQDGYVFKMLFGQDETKPIASVLGFPQMNMTEFAQSIEGISNPNFSLNIPNTSRLNFIVRNIQYDPSKYYNIQITQAYFNSYELFLGLKSILETATGYQWTIEISSANRIRISILNLDCSFIFLFDSDPMIAIATALGFETQNGWSKTIEATLDPNFEILLTNNNYLHFYVRNTAGVQSYNVEKSYIYKPNIPYFGIPQTFQFIENSVNQVNPAVFNMNLAANNRLSITSNLPYQIQWNYMKNLQNICGYLNPPLEPYTLYSNGNANVNLIDYKIKNTDTFNVNVIESQYTRSLDFYRIQSLYFNKTLENSIQKINPNPWKTSLSADNVSTLQIPSFKFRLEMEPNVKGIFNYPSNTEYYNSITGTASINPQYTLTSNNKVKIEFVSSKSIISNTISMEPKIYANQSIFCEEFNGKLNKAFENQVKFHCNVVGNNFIQVDTIGNTYGFRYLLGSAKNTSRLLGLETSNSSGFSYSVKSSYQPDFSGQFSRVVMNLKSIQTIKSIELLDLKLPSIIFNITDNNNKFYFNNTFVIIAPGKYTTNTFCSALQQLIQPTLVSSTDSIIRFESAEGFSIQWSKNKYLARLCGFNPYDTPIGNRHIGSFQSHFNEPKIVYLTCENIKKLNQSKTYILNNQATFFIDLENPNYNQMIEVVQPILTDKLTLALYDSDYKPLGMNGYWEATLKFA